MKFRTFTILLVLSAFVSCSKTDFDVPAQNTAFEKFLESRQYSYVMSGGVFRTTHIVGTGVYVEKGDSVYINYIGQIFASSPGTVFATNIEATADGAGLDKTFLSFEPKGLKLGDKSLMKGLDAGLQGCREGDSVLLLINSDLAYDKKIVGVVPAGSPLAFSIRIKKIVK